MENLKAGTRRKQENKAEVSKWAYLLFFQTGPAREEFLSLPIKTTQRKVEPG